METKDQNTSTTLGSFMIIPHGWCLLLTTTILWESLTYNNKALLFLGSAGVPRDSPCHLPTTCFSAQGTSIDSHFNNSFTALLATAWGFKVTQVFHRLPQNGMACIGMSKYRGWVVLNNTNSKVFGWFRSLVCFFLKQVRFSIFKKCKNQSETWSKHVGVVPL